MRYIVASGMMSKESKEKEIKQINNNILGIKHSISKSNKSALLKAQEEYYNRK